MSGPEDSSRQVIDVPKYPKTYTMPAVVHGAVEAIVVAANHGGAKTNKSEMLAVLVHHALTSMGDEELAAAWLTYRHADEDGLKTRPPSLSN